MPRNLVIFSVESRVRLEYHGSFASDASDLGVPSEMDLLGMGLEEMVQLCTHILHVIHPSSPVYFFKPIPGLKSVYIGIPEPICKPWTMLIVLDGLSTLSEDFLPGVSFPPFLVLPTCMFTTNFFLFLRKESVELQFVVIIQTRAENQLFGRQLLQGHFTRWSEAG
jgi:hypothetical protein